MNQATRRTPLIRRITLKFGSASAESPLSFEPGDLTLFVGPNNSGKSLALREFEGFLKGEDAFVPADKRPIIRRVLERLDVNVPTAIEFERILKEREYHDGSGKRDRIVRLWTITQEQRAEHRVLEIRLDELRRQVEAVRESTPRINDIWQFMRGFVSLFSLRLDTSKRMQLTTAVESQNVRHSPKSLHAAILLDDAKRQRIRELVHEAFGWHLVVDPTEMRNMNFRMSRRPPHSSAEERSLEDCARAFQDDAISLSEFSDGVKSYVGILAAILASGCRVFLIDEPDAFLHPPLARRLGRFLASESATTGSNVFAATHSEHFLAGCLESERDVNVVRLTYREEAPTARLLPSSRLRCMMRDPLLRSARVLAAVFHEGAVVCEADRDRAFYEEINHRLLAETDSRAVPDAVFLNAQNMQTVDRIVAPLRELGVPATAVLDFDALKDVNFKKIARAACMDEQVFQEVCNDAARVRKAIRDSEIDAKRQGVEALSDPERVICHRVLSSLGAHGIFVVPIGEVEAWLADLGVSAPKPRWLSAIFEAMGNDPADVTGYLGPQAGGVWDFLGDISRWIANPNRAGMPT